VPFIILIRACKSFKATLSQFLSTGFNRSFNYCSLLSQLNSNTVLRPFINTTNDFCFSHPCDHVLWLCVYYLASGARTCWWTSANMLISNKHRKFWRRLVILRVANSVGRPDLLNAVCGVLWAEKSPTLWWNHTVPSFAFSVDPGVMPNFLFFIIRGVDMRCGMLDLFTHLGGISAQSNF